MEVEKERLTVRRLEPIASFLQDDVSATENLVSAEALVEAERRVEPRIRDEGRRAVTLALKHLRHRDGLARENARGQELVVALAEQTAVIVEPMDIRMDGREEGCDRRFGPRRLGKGVVEQNRFFGEPIDIW